MSNNADEEKRETPGGARGTGGNTGEGGRGEHRGGERARGTGAEGNTAGEHGARWGSNT